MRFVKLIVLVSLLSVTSAFAAPQQTISGMNLDEGLDVLISQLVKALPEKRFTVAVADFWDLENRISGLGRYIPTQLSTRLVNGSRKIQVIEYGELEKTIQELRMKQTDLFDPAFRKRLGKFVGADLILAGTATDIGATVRIHARLFSTEQREVLSAASVTVTKDERVAHLLSIALEPASDTGQGYKKTDRRRHESSGSSSRTSEESVFQNGLLKVTVKSLTQSSGDLILEVWYENQTDQTMVLTSSQWGTNYASDQRGTYLLSDAGEKWFFREDEQVGRDFGGAQLIPHQRMLNRIRFEPEKNRVGKEFAYMGQYRIRWRRSLRDPYRYDNVEVVIKNIILE